MAPIRRYLRITKYSVLECRIYLDNPALAQSWLLNPRDPILPKVIESVRPLVLPKLREEQERSYSKKKSKKRSIKDVVAGDDFEVSIFLTETDTRHSLLHKKKLFRDKLQTRLTSNNSSRLVGASREAPIDIDKADTSLEIAPEDADADVPILGEDDDDQDAVKLADIPMIDETVAQPGLANRRPKRRRVRDQGQESEITSRDDVEVIEDSGEDDDDPGSSADEDEPFQGQDEDGESEGSSDPGSARRPPKRRKDKDAVDAEGEVADAAAAERDRDDKKKMALDISYEGFAIYGRVLCLVVKRRGEGAGRSESSAVSAGAIANNQTGAKTQPGRPGGQAMMENWIASTQLPDEAAEDDVGGPA
ncbi:uncharacterized protein C8A04DRAFT_27523 [Dichotomopilus funicola]|uniref:Uncharacterized protein n=1 Tax=Dichotomopilus funicola TaxID=1934379 RepID=A0AAN6V4M3_9PEZI|nr:hypothetical protein C8A04DRAFT_27523 [Dichotomopilus funicola]